MPFTRKFEEFSRLQFNVLAIKEQSSIWDYSEGVLERFNDEVVKNGNTNRVYVPSGTISAYN